MFKDKTGKKQHSIQKTLCEFSKPIRLAMQVNHAFGFSIFLS